MFTLEEIEDMEDENMMLTILQEEEEMEMRKPWVPPMVTDGEETDEIDLEV